ncbi:hypothetical protein [Streptomyces sp. V2]|uniref:hypothetical protein n=2 Tax=Streptomyces TaxID=1883 RepID=UPI001057E6A3|nr:hypothetical protein [Streptomyces sp. V2]
MRTPLRPAVTATALALSLAAGLGAMTAPAAHAEPVYGCGSQVSDYVGGDAVDTAFTGTVEVAADSRVFTVTPLGAGSVVMESSITAPNSTVGRRAVGAFTLRANAAGKGLIDFPVYAGKAYVTDVVCGGGGTRVTKMIGSVDVADEGGKSVDFTVERA